MSPSPFSWDLSLLLEEGSSQCLVLVLFSYRHYKRNVFSVKRNTQKHRNRPKFDPEESWKEKLQPGGRLTMWGELRSPEYHLSWHRMRGFSL